MKMEERIKPSMTWEEKVEITNDKVKDYKAYKPIFKEWMLNLTCKTHFFDHRMYFRCWQIYESLRDDHDHFILMLAPPGTGKSTLLMQMGAVISPDNFRLQQISYDYEGFVQGLKDYKRYDMFALDEGALILSAADRTSQGQLMDKLSAIMRQFNLCIGICMTDFFLLRRHFRNARINTMVVLSKRGKYRVLTGKAIDAVRQQLRNKNGNISAVRYPNGTFFDGYFNDVIPELNDITKESYTTLKNKHGKKFIGELVDGISEIKDQDEGKYIGVVEAAKALSVCTNTIRNKIKDGTIPAKKMGSKWCVLKEAVMN